MDGLPCNPALIKATNIMPQKLQTQNLPERKYIRPGAANQKTLRFMKF